MQEHHFQNSIKTKLSTLKSGRETNFCYESSKIQIFDFIFFFTRNCSKNKTNKNIYQNETNQYARIILFQNLNF